MASAARPRRQEILSPEAPYVVLRCRLGAGSYFHIPFLHMEDTGSPGCHGRSPTPRPGSILFRHVVVRPSNITLQDHPTCTVLDKYVAYEDKVCAGHLGKTASFWLSV